jgi:hypothetical protein
MPSPSRSPRPVLVVPPPPLEQQLILDEYMAGDSDLEDAQLPGHSFRRAQLAPWAQVRHLADLRAPWVGHQVPYRGVAEFMLPIPDRQIGSAPGCKFCSSLAHILEECALVLERVDMFPDVASWTTDVCRYNICPLKPFHQTSCCPVLHALCTLCHKRGHPSAMCLSLPADTLEQSYTDFRGQGKMTSLRVTPWSFLGPRTDFSLFVQSANDPTKFTAVPVPSSSTARPSTRFSSSSGRPTGVRKRRRGGVRVRVAKARAALRQYRGD